MSRKNKLEAGLAGLFSTPKSDKANMPIPDPSEPETNDSDLDQPEMAESIVEQLVPSVVVEEIEQAEEITLQEPPAEEHSTAPAPHSDTPPAAPSPRPDTPLPIPESPVDMDGVEKQLVVFTLDGEDYGLDISRVESIIKLQAITAVPRAQDFIEGITNLRGAVLPVVDLRKRFGMPTRENKDNRIVVVEMGINTIGMIVDTVTEVLRVPQRNIAPPSPVVTTIDSNYITGIAKVDDGPDAPGRLVVLLDLDQLLSTEEMTDSLN